MYRNQKRNIMTRKEIFDELVLNAPSYLKGIEIVEEDAETAEKIMKEDNLSVKEACDCVYCLIADTLGI